MISKDLKGSFVELAERFGLDKKQAKLAALEAKMAEPEFWSDSDAAQLVSKEHGSLKNILEPWLATQSDLNELAQMEELGRDQFEAEAKKLEQGTETSIDGLTKELRFDGPYDNYAAILTVQAGAGGTDAQDWAHMLRKMYLGWAEDKGLKVSLLSESRGEEAGIKSATLSIGGSLSNIYGRLRGEHGVHRLVRISPFNSGGTRETSFAMVEVVPEIDSPADVEIDDKDLKIDTFRASGNGGQSVNTTDSAVRLTHKPTGLTISMQNEKSQLQNKEVAMKLLRSKLAQLQQEQHVAKINELKGPNQDAAWGNQIRNYVLNPYTIVKDARSGYENANVDSVLDGGLDPLIESYLDTNKA